MALGLSASPVLAQEAEEARTTYEIRFLDLAPGKDGEWADMVEKHFMPARKAAGLPDIEVHWIMAGPWDIMMLLPMPGGMATMDTHNPATGAAYRAALLKQEGSEEAVSALIAKVNAMVVKADSYYSHTHP